MTGEPTEKEPEIIFEYECPVEELANFLSQDSGQGEDGRIKHTPESAEKRIKGFLEKSNVVELILKVNGNVIGCAFTFEQDAEELKKKVPYAEFFTRNKERVFEVKGVHIKSQQRGRGYGQMIMEKIMFEARQKGATKIMLSTFSEEDNPARRLYEKLGFREVAPDQRPDSYYMQYEYTKEK